MAPQAKVLNKKLAILSMIKERKDTLFAKFSNSITDKKKTEAWNEILEKAKSLGFVAAERDWKYLRDTMYGVWKTRSLEKRDNKRKTGTEGGKSIQLDEADEIILDIIGKDTPQIIGLNIGESMDPRSFVFEENCVEEFELELRSKEKSQHKVTVSTAENKEVLKRKKPRIADDLKECLLKKRKLQLLLLEKEDLLKTYQLYEMETKMGLTASKFTKHLFQKELDSGDIQQ